MTTPDPDSPDRTVDVCAPADSLAKAGTVLVFGVLVVTLLIGILDGTVPTDHVPSLSDLGTHKPCNWIWRWGFVQAASWGIWVAVFSQVAVAGGNALGTSDYVFLFLGCGALLCMAGMAIINKDEQATYHEWLKVEFFVFGDLYALGLVVLDSHRHAKVVAKANSAASTQVPQHPPFMPQALAVVAALSAIRYAIPFFAAPSLASSNATAVLEWVNMLALVGFFYADCVSRQATQQMSLSYLVDDYSGEVQASFSARGKPGDAVVVSKKAIGLV